VRKIGESNLLYYDEASIRAIFEATGGDPLMTRFLCNEIFRYLGGKGGIVQEGHLEPCVSQCLDARRPHIRRVHSDFLKGYFEDEADVVVQIALKTEVGETMSFKRLQQTFDSLGWDYPRLRDAVDNLKQLELIEEVGTKGKYRIRMGLLHRLLRQEQL